MRNATPAQDSATELLSALTDLIHSVSARSKQHKITSQSLLLDDLGLDSLDLVRMLLLIEEKYQVAIDLDAVPKLRQVQDLMRLVGQEQRSAA